VSGANEDISLSDRERVEGFQPIPKVAVTGTTSE